MVYLKKKKNSSQNSYYKELNYFALEKKFTVLSLELSRNFFCFLSVQVTFHNPYIFLKWSPFSLFRNLCFKWFFSYLLCVTIEAKIMWYFSCMCSTQPITVLSIENCSSDVNIIHLASSSFL